MTQLNEAGAGLSRVYDHFKHRNVAIVSAYRTERASDPDGFSDEDRLKRNELDSAALKNIIGSNGFGYIHLRGNFIERFTQPDAKKVVEESFLIIGTPNNDRGRLRDFATRLGKKYEQDCVLVREMDGVPTLIGTREGGWPGLGIEIEKPEWKSNYVGDFFSELSKKTSRDTNNPQAARKSKDGTRQQVTRAFSFESVGIGKCSMPNISTDYYAQQEYLTWIKEGVECPFRKL